MLRYQLLLVFALLSVGIVAEVKRKKDIRDYSDSDLDKLYEEWEENDEDKLEEDELPPYKRKPKTSDFDETLKQAKNPEDLLKLTKKGQSVMMFVTVCDVNGKTADKEYTEKWTSLWQSSLYNNHMDVQRFVIEDNRVIYMFMDGSKAWEAKEFLLKQNQVKEIMLEGKQYDGLAKCGNTKTEL
uniref:Mesoderm development candidate 2 n=1 Tax=Syphacia muris TaxID=451379 RepID=A0A0N5ANY1_9BILA